MDFQGQTQEQILKSFGYVLTQAEGTYGAKIEEDPEAFTVTGCASQEEAVHEAYKFLVCEVDENLHSLPAPRSFAAGSDSQSFAV